MQTQWSLLSINRKPLSVVANTSVNEFQVIRETAKDTRRSNENRTWAVGIYTDEVRFGVRCKRKPVLW